ncbi:hypothetical protein RvY_04837-2 [Ramazzottius varieornatus]|uniref:Uncharacterized protein n=1 Tax=Ramazzottius varieornatus TaxID=947166 RepID=A0A1D1UTL8_RAMVA|nr:hypothetical protein RvY_04837-2 [Ramazzottius varieornatus]
MEDFVVRALNFRELRKPPTIKVLLRKRTAFSLSLRQRVPTVDPHWHNMFYVLEMEGAESNIGSVHTFPVNEI